MANISGNEFLKPITFNNGLTGEPLVIESGNPENFYQAISEPASVSAHAINGQLFVPAGENLACVIVVPGSLGVADSHLAHAELLTDQGIAALVIDPFGSRHVTSTVANQAQYSFAASSWDVLASAKALAADGRIDSTRIGAQGHSRGGTAVVNAAVTRFVEAMSVEPLRAVYGAYPWCGFQFTNPNVGSTAVRSIIGDQDEWCLPQQVQAYMHAMQLTGGNASCRIIPGAQHSFDRSTPVELIEDASVAPSAPTTYLTDSGQYIHPTDGLCPPATMDRDIMLYGIKSGYGVRGARIGSSGDQADIFREDMLAFWTNELT